MLRNTNKKITIASIVMTLNWNDRCETAYFGSFVKWAKIHTLSDGHHIRVGEDSLFWAEWLQERPAVQAWLIEKGFAIKDQIFEPFSLKVETERDMVILWHRLNVSGGAIRRHTDGYPSYPEGNTSVTKLWNQVDKELQKRKIVK